MRACEISYFYIVFDDIEYYDMESGRSMDYKVYSSFDSQEAHHCYKLAVL